MVENLKDHPSYRDGTPIPNVTDAAEWGSLTTGAYCDYNNNPSNSDDYGRLYNAYAAISSTNIAPEGWHVPSFTELTELFNYVGEPTFPAG